MLRNSFIFILLNSNFQLLTSFQPFENFPFWKLTEFLLLLFSKNGCILFVTSHLAGQINNPLVEFLPIVDLLIIHVFTYSIYLLLKGILCVGDLVEICSKSRTLLLRGVSVALILNRQTKPLVKFKIKDKNLKLRANVKLKQIDNVHQ